MMCSIKKPPKKMNENINNEINLTLKFWNYFIEGNFLQLNNFISNNCEIKNNFFEISLIKNKENSLNYLKEFHSKLLQPTLKYNYQTLNNLILIKKQKQTRFLILNKNILSNLNYGIALNWLFGVIIEIVIIKNTNSELFFNENYYLNSSLSSEEQQNSNNNNNYNNNNDNDNENNFTTSTSLTTTSKLSSSSQQNYILNPPYLVPRPPIVPATLTVTIMECCNLKSRLVRVIERSVCSYVVVEFCDVKRRTETVKYNNFPSFNIHTNFIFEFNELQRNSSIYFTIMDEHFINDDILAQAEIPIESLPNRLDSSTPIDITLPLLLEGNIFEDSNSRRNRLEDFPPSLKVRVSKVDAQEWWTNEEIKARAEAEARRLERLEELEREVQLKFTAEKANVKSKRLSETSLSMIRLTEVQDNPQPSVTPITTENDIGESKAHWVDSSQVTMCME